MVKAKFQEYFPSKPNCWIYSCIHCRAHLARHEDLISKSFQGSQGRAYLFHQVVNVEYSEAKQRVLLTGIHFVADVYCACCNVMLGWRYERAFEASQRYKEGKVIVELAHLIKDNCWDTKWLLPEYSPSSSVSQPVKTQTTELSLPTALPLPHAQWPSSYPSAVKSISTEPSTSFPPNDFNSEPTVTQNIMDPDHFIAHESSSPIYAQFNPDSRSGLSTLPHSYASSCGLTSELGSWPHLLSENADQNSSTMAHGVAAQFDAQHSPESATSHFSAKSNIRSHTLSIAGDTPQVCENRGRPTLRGTLLNWRIPFGATASVNSTTTGSKHRYRTRATFAHRATSSSPSRAFLLALSSDDESDHAVGETVGSVSTSGVNQHNSRSAHYNFLQSERTRSTAADESSH